MIKTITAKELVPFYIFILLGCLMLTHFGSRAITVMAENAPIEDRVRIVVDAGHGGIDSGATSCSGVAESQLNLEIAFRLRDLLHFLGHDTVMVRTTDTSIHTEGSTIAAQKISDLKERAKLVNSTENSLLLSIHQNTFQDSRYSGAQVFYAPDPESEELAKLLQSAMIQNLNPGSKRKSKPSDGIYLMQHITCPGVLVECGFLSNPTEEAKLRDEHYQQQICCVIAASLSMELKK